MKLEKPDTRDYFSFYGLEPTFEISNEELKTAFLEKSKVFHPDFYANDPQSHTIAVMASAYNNLAYKTLLSEISRASYLIDLLADISENRQLPQSFLMEMLELNETIDELNEDNRYEIEDKISAIRQETLSQIREKAIQKNWDELQLHLLEWKYLDRLKERLTD
ncbi:MAG: Fe-S protein assembly co-chaperone HscB [Bacteroidia bacterium]|nr:Fe-S protein assembly co-chaperone HscB [Bacteroidia bacterium]